MEQLLTTFDRLLDEVLKLAERQFFMQKTTDDTLKVKKEQ